jgi:hypothetical protein
VVYYFIPCFDKRNDLMMSKNSSLHLIFLIAWIVLIAGCQTMDGSQSPDLTGGVKVRDEQLKSAWPAGLPRTVYVSDFDLQAEHMDSGREHKSVLSDGHLKKLGKRPPHQPANSNPEEQAKKIVDAMSRSLVEDLNENGLVARRLTDPKAALPKKGWLIQGVFTEAAKGSRVKRAVIGFGRGASRMEAQVAVSDLSGRNPKNPFIVFGTVKKPKKTPGAAVTMNPYVAAAKFVMEKNATEKDIRKTAKQIVGEILKHTQKFKEQAESVSGKPKP